MSNRNLFKDGGLGHNQVAIVDANHIVKYRRPTGDPAVREAIKTPGYFVVGPAVRISNVLATMMTDPFEARFVLDGEGHGAICHPDSNPWVD